MKEIMYCVRLDDLIEYLRIGQMPRKKIEQMLTVFTETATYLVH